LGKQLRGAYFLFFSIVLGWLTTKIAPEHATFIGRHAGGFFIYALSLPDAYRIAKIQSFKAQQEKTSSDTAENPPKAD
jgi:alkanesulfonate monooxygenase SsuD/methylene tetrahydromethanopterin reductase-like flavin-dependent oxidoreductase (luciferase family)